MKQCYLSFLFCLLISTTGAQHKLQFDSLNLVRIKTNDVGMKVLGSWSLANIGVGAVGYFTTDNKELKAFHAMNALWGVVNLGIAAAGYNGARKEYGKNYSCGDALSRYESNKRLFLINFGLDFAYIGGGAVMDAYADKWKKSETWHGYGKSIMMQGVFLLVFDGTMYALHQKQNKTWYKLLSGVCVTGNGVGINWRIQ